MRDLKGRNKVEHILKIFLIFKNYWGINKCQGMMSCYTV